ncbi:hypothetical protein B0H11DRAFT_2034170 [Mycena galericulata]|nr:hypothetical protein B0H11DRAFT_2034170 [Mycena galericulata]
MSDRIAVPYPVYGNQPPTFLPLKPPRYPGGESSSSIQQSIALETRHTPSPSRTPSPTPSESDMLNGIKPKRTTKERIVSLVLAGVVLTIAILTTVYNNDIVHALKPFTDWLRDHKAGPLIPILLFIIVSFPPLFGHEVIATLVGVTWNLPEACAIVAIGILLGEIANFFTFRYAFSARAAKIEAKNLEYGLLAYVVRRGGFLAILVIRYSTPPPHYTTVVFATVGVSFRKFIAAAILTLPREFVPVYTGYVLQPGAKTKRSVIIENIVFVVGILATIVAYRWVQVQTKAATPDFIYGRRKARQEQTDTTLLVPPMHAALA